MSRERFVFVLRLWNEAAIHRPLEPRGSLQSIHTDEIIYFHSPEEIPALLRQITGWMTTEGEQHLSTETESNESEP